MFKFILQEIRYKHWIKNFLLFVPLLFTKQFFNFSLLFKTILGFFSFSFIASCVYVINDILDKKQDQNHPKKKHRPIASGKLPINYGVIVIIVLFFFAFILATLINIKFLLVILIYLVINLFYSIKIKHIVIFDIITVSLFYLLRVYAGGIVINVSISQWLLLTIFFLSLFLVLSKRRSELIRNSSSNIYVNSSTRKVLDLYNKDILNFFISITFANSVAFYSLYSMTKSSVFIWSIFFVVFVLMRYLYLIFIYNSGEEPEELVLKDKQIFTGICLWTLFIIIVFYFNL